MTWRSLPLAFFLATAGCGGEADSPPPAIPAVPDTPIATPPAMAPDAATEMLPDAGPPAPVCEGDLRIGTTVYYGTSEPTAMPLRPGQILAIGTFGGCTGTFITDEWLLTANHCRVRSGSRFCVGEAPANPDRCTRVTEAHSHPQLDMSVARVERPGSELLPGLEPIPIHTEALDESWLGTIAEAAGYGRQEDGSSGEREFTAEPIDGFEEGNVIINGEGVRGVCFGDSGGPVMVLAADGTVRVAGDLSFGDPSCLGRDRYARTDLAVDWIEGFTGSTVAEGAGCGTLDAVGRCAGGRAVWCADDEIRSEPCEGFCGWDAGAEGYRCQTGEDPCGGVDEVGECRGSVALWCERGTLRQRDCAPCDQVCGDVQEVGGAYCQDDPCMGIDYQGQCDGDVAVWCDEGEVKEQDCGARGLRCDFVNDRIGFFCTR